MRKKRTNRPSPEICSLIAKEYESGCSSTSLATKYDLSFPTILGIVRSAGVRIRTLADRNRSSATPVDETTLRLLIDQKLSTTEIAVLMKVSQPTIEMKMRRMGLRSKHGRGSKLEKNYFWKGGKTKTRDGYIYVKMNNHPHATVAGYVLEHRLVMEREIGRYLKPKEIVHHEDKNRSNNHPSNLLLFENNAAHLKYELTGQIPNYTADGLQRMRENALRLNHRKYGSSLAELETDVAQSPLQTSHPQESPDTENPSL